MSDHDLMFGHPRPRAAATNPPRASAPGSATVDGTRVDLALYGFYVVVALIALAGQAGAAVQWLGWPLWSALSAVAAVELGGIALSAYADHRRRLGERAAAARVLSAAVAAGAVAVNWFGHHDRMQAGFFAGMSALGYLVWLLHSGARRRDQLRAAGTLPPVPPAYGPGQWLRHPGLTRRARALALADPSLGLYGSLHAARTAARIDRRQAAIATALRRKLTAAVDPLTAEIATATFDLDEIAARLAATADYDGLTALIAADLTPTRLAPAAGNDTPAAEPGDGLDPDAPCPVEATPKPKRTTGRRPAGSAAKRQPSAAERVAKAAARNPDATPAQLAARLKLSERTVQRHLKTAADAAANTPTVPVLHAA